MVNIANDRDNAARAATLAGADPIPIRAGGAGEPGTATTRLVQGPASQVLPAVAATARLLVVATAGAA